MTEIERYGWRYRIANNACEIIPSEKDRREPPNSLYKYFDISNESVDCLLNSYLYAPHPWQLNDPFDCYSNLINFDDPESAYEFTKSRFSLEDIKKKFANKDVHFFDELQYNLAISFYQRIGIISLTESPHEILMWSYYSKHKGFCVEYDYRKFPFDYYGPFQINYQDNLNPISISSVLDNKDLAWLYQTNVKTDRWKHENEWRIIAKAGSQNLELSDIEKFKSSDVAERKFRFDLPNIKSVILGISFFHRHNEYKVENRNDLIPDVVLQDCNSEKKEKIIDFLIENKIKTYMILGTRNLSLSPVKVEFQKIEKNRYKIQLELKS